MVRAYELINKIGVSVTTTPKSYLGKIYVCDGIWNYKCDEDIHENDSIKVSSILSFGLLKVEKI